MNLFFCCLAFFLYFENFKTYSFEQHNIPCKKRILLNLHKNSGNQPDCKKQRITNLEICNFTSQSQQLVSSSPIKKNKPNSNHLAYRLRNPLAKTQVIYPEYYTKLIPIHPFHFVLKECFTNIMDHLINIEFKNKNFLNLMAVDTFTHSLLKMYCIYDTPLITRNKNKKFTTNDFYHEIETLNPLFIQLDNVILNVFSVTDCKNLYFIGFEQLRSLSLRNCYINDDEVLIISKYISKQPHLYKVDLSHNNIEDLGINYILQSFEVHKSIRSFNISGNFLKMNGLKKVIQFSSESQLIELEMSDYNFQFSNIFKLTSNSFTNFLTMCLKKNKSLKYINISKNNLFNTDQLITFLSYLQNLEFLNLSYTQTPDIDFSKIAEKIQNHPTLKMLDISYCNLSSQKWNFLIEAIEKNKSIETLILKNQPTYLWMAKKAQAQLQNRIPKIEIKY